MKTGTEALSSALGSASVNYAVELMLDGFMCSEAVVMAFAKEFGLKPEIALKISSGFAGGMAQGKTCGAVTGAIMLIGLKYGAGLQRDQYLKERCFQVTQEFSHRFMMRRKSLECDDILILNQIDPRDPEEMKHLREKRLCDKIVKDAVEILEVLFQEERL